jgi:hypothetical protein
MGRRRAGPNQPRQICSSRATSRSTNATNIEVAGIEFIETIDGRIVTYDVNTSTNYNADVEAVAPHSGPTQIARLLGRLLREQYPAEV